MTATIPEQLLSPKETAKLLGVREQTLAVWRCTQRHDLPFLRVGRLVRYRSGDVHAWQERHMVATAACE